MPVAKLLQDRETEKDFQIIGGRIITIVYDEWDISFSFNENGNKMEGEFEFKDEDGYEKRFLLKRMYSPIPKAGLGREVLNFFLEIHGGIIYTRPNDGLRRDDGSHLTGDALIFVNKMQNEGLIETWHEPY